MTSSFLNFNGLKNSKYYHEKRLRCASLSFLSPRPIFFFQIFCPTRSLLFVLPLFFSVMTPHLPNRCRSLPSTFHSVFLLKGNCFFPTYTQALFSPLRFRYFYSCYPFLKIISAFSPRVSALSADDLLPRRRSHRLKIFFSAG